MYISPKRTQKYFSGQTSVPKKYKIKSIGGLHPLTHLRISLFVSLEKHFHKPSVKHDNFLICTSSFSISFQMKKNESNPIGKWFLTSIGKGSAFQFRTVSQESASNLICSFLILFYPRKEVIFPFLWSKTS